MSFGFGVKMVKDNDTQKVLFMYVDSIDPESDARRKGLDLGARIMAIEDKPITEFDATFSSGSELNRIFANRNRGAVVTLEIIPLGSSMAKTVRVVERPFLSNSDNLFSGK